MESGRIIPDHQFGFRRGHSTVDQVHRLVADIRETYDRIEYSLAVFLVSSKAFDRVDHHLLLLKVRASWLVF